ncbi:hypothetical protein D3C86_1901720 [compost metagenome]
MAAASDSSAPVRSAVKAMPKGGSQRPITMVNGPSVATFHKSAASSRTSRNSAAMATVA